MLSSPHSLFNIWTDLKRSEKIPGAPACRWGEWIWLTGPSGLHRNLLQGLNISSIRVFHQIRDLNIPIIICPSFSNPSVALLILQPFGHFTYVPTHSPTLPSLYLRHSSFSNPSVASPTSQFILQPFFRFYYVTSSSLNSPGEPPMKENNKQVNIEEWWLVQSNKTCIYINIWW